MADGVNRPLLPIGIENGENRLHVDPGRLQQRLAKGPVTTRQNPLETLRAGALTEKHLSHQGVAVGMKSARNQADDLISRLDPVSEYKALPLGRAHGEAGQLVVAGRIEAGHLGGLAAENGAAGLPAALGDTLDQSADRIRLHLPHGDVVEKEQGLRSLDDEVIDAHRHQVNPDRIRDPHPVGDLELGTDSIGAGDKNRILEVLLDGPPGIIEPEHPGKASMASGQDLRRIGTLDVTGDTLDGGIAGVNVYP